ncbi:DNA excision repair protein ERCC-6-like [Sarotherodon galilaeus]
MAEIRTQRPPPNHCEDLQTQTGCFCNLGTRTVTPETMGVCLSTLTGGTKEWLCLLPPQDDGAWRILFTL